MMYGKGNMPNDKIIDIKQVQKNKQKKPKKKLSKRAKHKKLRSMLLLIGLVVVVFGIIFYFTKDIIVLHQKQTELKNEQQQLEKEKKELQKQQNGNTSNEYIENEAREKLNLVLPGEKVFVLPLGGEE